MPPVVEVGRPPLPQRWPLVGRRVELDRIGDVFADDAIRGVLIHGAAGVGKTRLADEVFDAAQRAGRAGGRVVASAGAAGVSLGALIPLLPVAVLEQRFDPVALYATVADAFRTQAGERAYVLMVDDLHRLDAASVTLLGQLVDNGVVFLVGTVRSGEVTEVTSESVVELWRRDHILRIDLENLERDDIDTLLYLALSGPVDAATEQAIWDRSRGNVLFARELVLGAHGAGHLVEQQGIWRLVAPLPNTARLAELVDTRLASVPAEASDLLGMLAVREPLGVIPLIDLMGPEPLEMLEAASLLRIYNDRRRQLVSLAHPLYGEIVRERMSPLMRRRFLNLYADTIESFGARRRADPLRVANARLDASGVADHALVLTAARLARYGHDYPQVERLARAALEQQPTPEAVLLLTEALHELGTYAEAENVLLGYAAVVDAAPEEFRIPLIAMRVRNLMWGLRRADDALAVNRAAREVPLSDAAAAELAADEAMVLAFAGRPAEALDLLGAQSGGGPRAAVIRSIAEVPALILTGKCETALEVARAAYRAHNELGDQLAIAHPGIHLIQRAYALADIGRLDDAESFGRAAFDASTRVGAPLGTIWYAYGLGRAAFLRGRVQTARRWLAEMAGRCSDAGYDGPRRIALSLLATCDAQLGDVDGAADAIAALDTLPPFAYRDADQELGRAWLLAARGDLQGARDLLVQQAEAARATGQRAIEMWLLHDVVRLGEPGRVRDALEAAAAECEGAFAPVRAAHGRAAAGRAPAALMAVAESFAELGALLYAAETATSAAQAFRQRSDNRAAHGAATRAAAWAQQCEGATTPGLVDIAAPEPLTAREREIATLAAERLRSKEIAQRLSLSVRTIDNHLQRIYSKLGVTSRTELADALEEYGDATS